MVEDAEASQFVHFGFYRVVPAWWAVPPDERRAAADALEAVLADHAERFFLVPYGLHGLRAEADLLLWKASRRLEDFQDLALALRRTPLGPYLETPYAYLSMTRRSQYVAGHVHGGQEGTRTAVRPPKGRYLCVYPFVKTHAWYQLPFEQRKGMMAEHFRVGHKYPGVTIHTTYAFGLDDPEFVLAFDTDDLASFVELVMELREAAARPYTLKDTPIFTCVRTTPAELAASLV